jgi:hypothetical protein
MGYPAIFQYRKPIAFLSVVKYLKEKKKKWKRKDKERTGRKRRGKT